jgi:hypothetical protein
VTNFQQQKQQDHSKSTTLMKKYLSVVLTLLSIAGVYGDQSTAAPTESPAPSPSPSEAPTAKPTSSPSIAPSREPSPPTVEPTESPAPSPSPSHSPTASPSKDPTTSPSEKPTFSPTLSPSGQPTMSQSPTFGIAPYNASSIVITFESVKYDVQGMNDDDKELFESAALEYLQQNFISDGEAENITFGISEIDFKEVSVISSSVFGGSQGLRALDSIRTSQTKIMSVTINVMAFVRRDWDISFDFKERLESFFSVSRNIHSLRNILAEKGADYAESVRSEEDTNETTTEKKQSLLDPEGSGTASAFVWLGAAIGSVFVAGIFVKMWQYRKSAQNSHQSKLSLASTDSQEDEDDESSRTQMIVPNNPYRIQMEKLYPEPKTVEMIREDSFLSEVPLGNNKYRPAFLKMDSNIEVPLTPIGFTPNNDEGVRSFILDLDNDVTPSSVIGSTLNGAGQVSSTRSGGFRRFLMDTPPSVSQNNGSRRGFFQRPPQSTSQRFPNATPKVSASKSFKNNSKETMNVSSMGNVRSMEGDDSSVQIVNEIGFLKATTPKAASTKGIKKSGLIAPSAIATARGRFRALRKWPSGYISDDSEYS